MSFQPPTMPELAALLTTYCNACVYAAREAPWGDEALVSGTANAVVIAARDRGCCTDELFMAFENAWNRDQSWGALPHSLQSAAYDRALTLLSQRFLDES